MSETSEPKISPEMLEDFKKEANLALNGLPDEVQKMVLRFTGLAIMSERQRCAKIAAEFRGGSLGQAEVMVCIGIAKKIREGGPS